MAATFISATNIKDSLPDYGASTANDALLASLAEAVESLWEELTGRKWVAAAFTEYHNAAPLTERLLLKNRPVAISPAVQIWDDPDWEWNASDAIAAADFRVDYESGIIYHNGVFFTGYQSIKVIYTAGYTALTVPAWLKMLLIRQAAHWYQQLKNRTFDKSSESTPAGGTTGYKELRNNMLPDFVALAEQNYG